jgi:selenoprotein W-related protein
VKKAASLAESILHDYHKQLPNGVTLVPGSGGVFEVTLGDLPLFSKKATGRFPTSGEVEALLEEVYK